MVFSVPVHVQRKTTGNIHHVKCELEECCQFHLFAQRSGLPFSQCEHLRSLDYCHDTAFEDILNPIVLDEMVALKFFGNEKKAVCLKRQKAARAACVPFSVLVEFGGSNKQITLSIHEPTIHYYSRLGRVMVCYNSTDGNWHCPCAKARTSCTHKNIGKWHLFQINRDLFKTGPSKSADAQTMQVGIHVPNIDLQRSVQYVFDEKKIPAFLPDAISKPKSLLEYPTQLCPVETTCTFCSEQTVLEMPLLVTKKAKIATMAGVMHDVWVYTRRCPVCHVLYRYQEWQDGLHNFDNHLFLSLELCLYLRQGLQNHISTSRAINTLEGLRGVQYPNRDSLLHGYLHFEALTDNDYSYSCVNCGYHPPVVIMDLHKKGVFGLAVSDLKEPPGEFKGEVDIEQFWRSVCLEMVARGFFPSRAQNPFSVEPTYENWAPWIGKHTRKAQIVLNTEYEKVTTSKSAPEEAQIINLSEDRLVDELMKQKVGVVRKLCRACNIDSRGSRMDMLSRLRAEMRTRQCYDKIFQKIWGASGGWSVILCPHGVVYSLKFNLRAESPRDYADLLFSWRHLPNVSVYDFARGLATHGNLRMPSSIPFQPHEGRLAKSTQENIDSAKQGRLKISLPWLTEKSENPSPQSHPVTGSADHYVLYDRLHESNTKDPQDVLRRINLVPELQGWLNSQVVEQFFANLRKSNYFLNNMAASTHIFMMRNIVHYKNTTTNKKILELQLQRGHRSHDIANITFSDLGQSPQ
ncbi:HMG domain-containing protein 3 [Erpetoichthys calabaricus]|uniref:HMG domain-containing protein 3 n=1 Tax=Erpetoichthys calabaricus TaxID=27687 RepID=UPI0022343A7B|nr:HMG domain-containing protein 3 [Erpetoichthys calabaricus]